MHPKVYAAAAIILSKYAAFNLKEVEQIIGGLMYGFVQEDDLTNIELCLKDAQTVDEELTEAIQDFEKKDLKDLIKGVQEIGVVVKQLSTDLTDCEGIKADVARIEKWAEIFTKPLVLVPTLVKNVIKNYKTIETDVSDINTQLAIGTAVPWNVGRDIADIMIKTVGPVPAAAQPEDLEFTQW